MDDMWLYFVILGLVVQFTSGNVSEKCSRYIHEKISEFTAEQGMLP